MYTEPNSLSAADAAHLTTAYPTVQDVLRAPSNRDLIGHGSHAHVYRFPTNIGFDNYVLRVTNPAKFKALLQQNTALTPCSLVCHVNIGQPLVALEDAAEIILRQPGISLKNRYEYLQSRMNAPFWQKQAWIVLLEEVLHVCKISATNPFLRVFEKAYKINQSGHHLDLNNGNLFIDYTSHRLALVDQIHESSSGPTLSGTPSKDFAATIDEFIGQLLKYGTDDLQDFPRVARRYQRVSTALGPYLNQARDQVIACHAQDDSSRDHGLRFAHVNDMQAISLDAPSHQLQEQLRRLEMRANIFPFL